ncbi:ABC transporter ATP-binding protein [Salinispira pacifica]
MSGEPFIRVRDLSKQFATRDGEIEALSGVSFDIREGEFLAVIGPSGCGKSTMLTILAGLLDPTSGWVEIGGERVSGPYTDLGIVFQNHVLLDWLTTIDNVLFQTDMRRLPRREYEARARELLRMVSLDGFEDRHPYELSGGMKQRTAICRALLHDPPLLLMDEPFGALDALTRDQLCIDVEKIWMSSRKTVVFITHSVQEAVQLADRILVMTPRPGRMYKVVDVDLPRPRYRDGIRMPEYGRLIESIKETFLEQGVLRA